MWSFAYTFPSHLKNSRLAFIYYNIILPNNSRHQKIAVHVTYASWHFKQYFVRMKVILSVFYIKNNFPMGDENTWQ